MNNWLIQDTIDLTAPASATNKLHSALMVPGDNQAHTWELTVNNGTEAANLSGYTAKGYFALPGNANTVLVNGTITGNIVSVTFPQNVYATSGILRVIVRMTKSSTTVTLADCYYRIGETLPNQYIDPGQIVPDLEELLAQIETMEEDTAAAETVIATANSTIAQMNDLLNAPAAPAVLGSGIGENVKVKYTAERAVADIHIYGKSKQITTTGKNKLALNSTYPGSSNSVTFADAGHGKISVTGTCTSSTYINRTIGTFQTENGVSYVVSGCPSGGAESGAYSLRVGSLGIDTGSGATFTGNGNSQSVQIRVYKDYPAANTTLTFEPMIRLASATDATFEPYSGGEASPAPAYPQNIDNVGGDGTINIDTYGANLLTGMNRNREHNSVTFSSASNGGVSVSGTASANAYSDANPSSTTILAGGYPYVPAGAYHVPATGVANVQYTVQVRSSTYETILVNGSDQVGYAYASEPLDFTIDQPGYIYLRVRVDSGLTANGTVYPALYYKNCVPEDFEAYSSAGYTVPITDGLRAIPATSGGNYTDENGQQWLCDEIDFRNNKLIRRTNLVKLVGTETINKGSSGDNWRFTYSIAGHLPPQMTTTVNTNITQMCSHFTLLRNAASIYTTEGSFIAHSNGTLYFKPASTITTVDELKAWLVAQNTAGTPLVFIYPLATPEEITLTSEQVAALSAIKSRYCYTHMYSSEEPYAGLYPKLVLDTKRYIDSVIENAVSGSSATRSAVTLANVRTAPALNTMVQNMDIDDTGDDDGEANERRSEETDNPVSDQR